MTPSIAAVANAVSNALGTRVTELPITAERVLAAAARRPRSPCRSSTRNSRSAPRPDAVWDFLLDPERLAPCLPGCESLEVEDATDLPGPSHRQGRLSLDHPESPRRRSSSRIGPAVSCRSGAARIESSPARSSRAPRWSWRLPRRAPRSCAIGARCRVLGRLGSVGDAVMKVKAGQLAGEFAANVRAAIESGAVILDVHAQRTAVHHGGARPLDRARSPAGRPRAARDQVRLRRGRVRHVHGARRRPTDSRLSRAGGARARPRARDRRRARGRRTARSAAGRVRRARRAPSADSARRACCWPQRRSCSKRRRPPRTRSAKRCRAISAAVPATPRSSRPCWPRRPARGERATASLPPRRARVPDRRGRRRSPGSTARRGSSRAGRPSSR